MTQPSEFVREAIRDIKGYSFEDPILDENSIRGTLGLDSLDVADLVYQIEYEYNIDIKDVEMDSVKTIGDFIKLIESKC